MALRLARAYTGKTKFVRFRTHFHGWHDHMTAGYSNHFDGTPTVGVIEGIANNVILADPQDISDVNSILGTNDDIAAVICEPTGASFGMVPMSAEFCTELREITEKHGVLLVFDEVVTGFRCSPGGAQQAYGVTPDITTLAKILAGGLPGGAVAGRLDILEYLDFERSAEKKREKVQHPGTFNANPVSAAAGISALKIIDSTDACETANQSASWLRMRFNEILASENVPWAAYGTFSGVHLFLNADGQKIDHENFDAVSVPYQTLKGKRPEIVTKLRLAMAVNGVDFNNSPGAQCSSTHTQADLDFTADAFREAIGMLRQDGEL